MFTDWEKGLIIGHDNDIFSKRLYIRRQTNQQRSFTTTKKWINYQSKLTVDNMQCAVMVILFSFLAMVSVL